MELSHARICRCRGRTRIAMSRCAGRCLSGAVLESIAGTRARRHKEWRRRLDDPPHGALYGAKKLAKTKLAGSLPQFLTYMDFSYNIGPLRCFPALSLFASSIRDHEGAAVTARPVRLPAS